MRITLSKRLSKKAQQLRLREWAIEDLGHYGPGVTWKNEDLVLTAWEGKDVVGVIRATIEMRVMYLKSLIVERHLRGKGIGKALVERMEDLAREKGCHKVYLYTGQGWEAVSFYERMGYFKEAELKGHYLEKDFLIYSKFLKM